LKPERRARTKAPEKSSDCAIPPGYAVSFPVSDEIAIAIDAAISDAERFGGTPDFVVIDDVEYRFGQVALRYAFIAQ